MATKCCKYARVHVCVYFLEHSAILTHTVRLSAAHASTTQQSSHAVNSSYAAITFPAPHQCNVAKAQLFCKGRAFIIFIFDLSSFHLEWWFCFFFWCFSCIQLLCCIFFIYTCVWHVQHLCVTVNKSGSRKFVVTFYQRYSLFMRKSQAQLQAHTATAVQAQVLPPHLVPST